MAEAAHTKFCHAARALVQYVSSSWRETPEWPNEYPPRSVRQHHAGSFGWL